MKRLGFFLILLLGFVSFVSAYDLRLTEVFVDGTDEWVEISNMSNDPFVGIVSLSGAKSTLLTLPSVSLPAWSSLIIGDNLAMFTSLNGFQFKTGLALNFGDTNALNVSLLLETTVVDTFIVDTGSVVAIDNQKTSFHKQFSSGVPSIISTVASLSLGVSVGFLAHPGRVYDINGGLLMPQISSGGTGTDTGSITTGISLDCGSVFSGILRVDEIHDGSQYSDYIELLFLTDWVGGLQFSGSALTTTVSVPSQSWKANTRYLIANDMSGFVHTSNIIIASGLQITKGLLSVSSLYEVSLDYVLIDTIGQSVYSTQLFLCVHDFATLQSPSPGFDHQFLDYLNTKTITTTITGSCQSSGTTSGGSTGTVGTATGSSVLSGVWGWHDIRLSLIDYDPPGSDTNNERIGLLPSTGDGLSLTGFSLSYDGKLFYFTTGTLFSGVETIVTANYVFVNSRPVCITLYYNLTQIDTACYDPSQHSSPFYPGVLVSSGTTNSGDEQIDYAALIFDIANIVYDPPGSDTNAESMTLTFLSGASSVVLDNFRLRVGTSNRRIYGTIISGQTITLVGNFMMSNSNATCVALTYNEIIYDEYCYNPVLYTPSSPTTANVFDLSSVFYTDRHMSIQSVDYDPPGSDTDRETVMLLMTGYQGSVDLSKLYLRWANTKRKLSGTLASSGIIIITGNFQMPNTKATCIDLMEGLHVFDTYCYDPLEIQKQIDLTGDIQTDMKIDFSPDWSKYYSGLQLQWILPNPKDKDSKNLNEKFALSRRGGSGQKLTKQVKLVVGKTSISLSGYTFDDEEVVIASPKVLTNQQSCARLMVDGVQVDMICYPQAKEGQVFYHSRLDIGPQTIPSSLIESLDRQQLDFSSLRLKKIGKQICLRYDDVSIHCMAAGSSTDPKTKALTTLSNAYIREMGYLIDDKNMDYQLMHQWTESYHILAKAIKSGKFNITLYGYDLKSTDIEGYRSLVYEKNEIELIVDVLARSLIGSEKVENWYKIP